MIIKFWNKIFKKKKKIFKFNKNSSVSFSNEMLNSKSSLPIVEGSTVRDTIFLAVVILVFLTLVSRLVYLQFFNYEKYSELATQNRFKMIRIVPERGKIYDVNNKMLATNGMGYRLIYKKERNVDPENIEYIAKMTGFDKELIEKRIKYGEISPYIKENVLFEDLEEELAHKLIEKLEDSDLIEVQIYSKRRYIYDSLASHTIGYVKKISDKEYERLRDKGYSPRDVIGKIGIEKEYDDVLKGKSGYKYIEVNAQNKILSPLNKTNLYQKAIPGKDIILGIDLDLQEFMEKEFAKDKTSGAFIALDPKSGLIKTIVSFPTYSLNTFSSQISQELWTAISTNPQKPLTNKTIAGVYPPGSTFKVVSSMAFLKSGINPHTTYLDNTGYYQIGKWKWRAWKRGGHGYVDMKKSLVESANPYYYRLADQVGSAPIIEAAKAFGLGEVTGIDIPGERKGIVPSPEWKKKKMDHRGIRETLYLCL